MFTQIDTHCKTCADHQGWATADQGARRDPDDYCPDCLGSGVQGAAKVPADNILDAIMAVETGEASPLETLETFGLLIQTGIVGSLQGSWQRSVADAVRGNLLTPDGNLTDHALEYLGTLAETEEF